MTVTVLHANALDLPLDLFEQCDFLNTDTPYSDYVHTHAMSCRTAGAGPVAREFGFDSLSPELMRRVCVAAASVRRWSLVYCDLESTHLWREEMARLGLEYVREVAWPDGAVDAVPARWIRWSQPQLSGDRPPTGAEATLVFHRAHYTRTGLIKPHAKHWNGSGGLTHWTARALRGGDKGSAEKPLDLYLAQVSAFSDLGETGVDLAAGRGGMGLACRLLGRDALLVEVRENEAKRAEDRNAAPLDIRDRERAERWAEETLTEAASVPEVAPGEIGRAAWERAQRRLADALRVAESVS